MDYGTQMGLVSGLNAGLENFLKTYTQMRQMRNQEQNQMLELQRRLENDESLNDWRRAQAEAARTKIAAQSPEAQQEKFEREQQGKIQVEQIRQKGRKESEAERAKAARGLLQERLAAQSGMQGMNLQAQSEMQDKRLAAQQEVAKLKQQGRPVPAELKEMAESQPMGMIGKRPSGDEFKAASFARRLEQAEDVFGELEKSGYNRAARTQSLAARLPGELQSPQLRQQEQAERNFVNAVLRRESGAAISPSEFQSAEQQYFPRPGDTPEVLAQKRANRLQVQEGLKGEGSRALGLIQKVPVAAKAAPALAPQDQAALQWAQSNPQDPRAAQILKTLGQ